MNEHYHYTVALAGNPNVGKTTVFNMLTGSHQFVGNWPGVTVEYKEGHYTYMGTEIRVVDLPGTYSLGGGSPDEQVAQDFLLAGKPDLIVNIVDASNLERNLYLTVQLLELQKPVLVVLTMLDIAKKNGIEIDAEHLKNHLACDVVQFQLFQKQTDLNLRETIRKSLETGSVPKFSLNFDEVVETGLSKLEAGLDWNKFVGIPQRRWLALQLLTKNEHYTKLLNPAEKDLLEKIISGIEKHRGEEITNIITADRYSVIRGLIKDVVKRKKEGRKTWSDKVDSIVLSKAFGLPIFFLVMFIVFSLTVKASQPLIKLIKIGLDWLLVQQTGLLFQALNFPLWLNRFLTAGIGSGLVTIATFLPPIFFIFACLACLEDSGYMARAAFVADKFMRRIGLPGKAFIPLLVGFGCSVPAIMATRTLDSKRDRVMASLLVGFMSCGAKLPVYTYLSMLFFPKYANLIVFGLYMTGILLGMGTGLLLKKTLFRSQPADFIMELPAYHLPTLNGILMHAWHRLRDFAFRAGKTILSVIVLIYILQMITIPVKDITAFEKQTSTEKVSVLEIAGKAITPALSPMGINSHNWHASVALLSGLFAKEAIVGALQSLYYVPEGEDLQDVIKWHFGSQAAGFAYLLFILLYSPCAAALATLWKEHGVRWMLFAFGFLTLQAWLIATLFYQSTQLISGSAQAGKWLFIIALIYFMQYLILRSRGKHRERFS
ncbi:MAG TPA: ferrous iron transport protein B [Candidatus Cloacimonadota bacterium]|nr:ferrous iron transport protein B [Candidatus Cloacimonadota bacterium]